MSSEARTVAWKFLEKVPGMPTADGNITRSFNTGDSRPPASFSSMLDRSSESAISAAIYGREGIANCLDASLAFQRAQGTLGLDFVFTERSGASAAQLWSRLGLSALAEHLTRDGVTRKAVGLSESDCLAAGPSAGLRTLTVTERGGGGMPGALDEPGSVLARALISVGEAQQRAGAAGSYGYGKAAVAQASRIRVIVVYTCFEPTSRSTATRRLLGLAYWGGLISGGKEYTGWSLLGLHNDGPSVDALEDEAADAFAAELGMENRDPGVERDRGTTFLIVDPSFTAEELLGAAEVFWWPLLQKTRPVQLSLSITDVDGTPLMPDVGAEHSVLGQHVASFLAAEQARSDRMPVLETQRTVILGDAGITSLVTRAPSSLVSQSLVAQMRSPLMVVNYFNASGANPPVVGVFVAHDSANENLRRVEPPEHDKWHQQNVGGLNASAKDIQVSKMVRHERDEAIAALRAPDPEPIYGISAFADHFPAVDVRAARPRSETDKREHKQRLVRVHLVHADEANKLIEVDRPTRHVRDDGRLQAEGEVKFFLDPERAKRVGKSSLQATITVGARIAEDGGTGTEWWPATVSQKVRDKEVILTKTTNGTEVPAKYEGTIELNEPIYFVIVTEPYPPDWTVEMVFDCSPWDVVTPPAVLMDEEAR